MPARSRALQHVHDVMRGDADVLDRTAAAVPAPPAASRRRARSEFGCDAIDVDQRVVERRRRRRSRGCPAWSTASWSRSPATHRAARDRRAHARGNRTQIVCEVWSWYSTSASASAVFSTGDHSTGRSPRYSAPFSRNLQISAGDRRLRRMVHAWRSARARRPRRRDGGTRPSAPPSSAPHRRGTRRGTAAPGPRPCPSSGLAVLLLDLPLDRQAVAVPAGDVVGVVARHLAGAVDDVLVDLVQRGADMDVAVRVGRAVVQDEFRPPARGGAQPRPQVHLLPAGEDLRLALRQVAAHRERGLRQEHGVAVVALGGSAGASFMACPDG